MPVVLVSASSVIVFLMALWLAGVVPAARSAISMTRGALGTMRDPDIDDLARERAVRAAAVRLLGVSASLALRSLLAVAAAFVPILAADFSGVAPMGATLSFMQRWDVILVATGLVMAGYLIGIRTWTR